MTPWPQARLAGIALIVPVIVIYVVFAEFPSAAAQ